MLREYTFLREVTAMPYLESRHGLEGELLHRGLPRVVVRGVVEVRRTVARLVKVARGERPVVARAKVHSVHPLATVVDRETELADVRHPKRGHRVVLPLRPRRARLTARYTHCIVVRGLPTEADVLVDVELQAVGVREEAGPVGQAQESVVHDDPGTVALASAGRGTHDVIGLNVAG